MELTSTTRPSTRKTHPAKSLPVFTSTSLLGCTACEAAASESLEVPTPGSPIVTSPDKVGASTSSDVSVEAAEGGFVGDAEMAEDVEGPGSPLPVRPCCSNCHA